MNTSSKYRGTPWQRTWRLLWAMLAYGLFGLGGLLVGLLIFPVLGLLVWNSQRRQVLARRILSRLFGAYQWFLGWVQMDIGWIGLEAVQHCRRSVVVANHPSLLDSVFLLAAFPGADCVVKRSHWYNPFTMLAVRFARYIPNHDTEQVLDVAASRLKAGGCLVLFPEGTRTTPGEQSVYKRGAAVAAWRAEADLILVRICSDPDILAKQQPWYDVPTTRIRYRLEVVAVIRADEFGAYGDNERRATRKLTEKVQSLLDAG